MKRGIIVTAVILSFLIIATNSNAETKITPGGVTFPDNATQSKAWTTGDQWSFEDICYNPVGALGGRVGIGTSNPAAKLHIKGNDFPYTFIYLDTNAANQDAGIRFYENSSVKGHLYHDASEGLLRLEANKAQLVMSSSDGNVGIGTSSPNYDLEVVGDDSMGTIMISSRSSPSILPIFTGDSSQLILAGDLSGLNSMRLQYNGLTDRLDVYGHDENGSYGPHVSIRGDDGWVGINTPSPHYTLEVNGTAAKPDGGAWSNSSDGRLKDISGGYDRGLDQIASLKPVTFYYKEGNPRGLPSDEEYVGFVAQEVQDVFPKAVSEGKDGYLDFNMHRVSVAVVNAIKELKSENEALKIENRALRQDIEQIKVALGL
jgi:hypothetical protein